MPFRIQAYGTPPATVSSYRYADRFEGEGWGWQRLPQTRWASSAAHLYGRAVVSAEAWTWVHSPSFRATPLDLKGEAHEHLLNGVNLLVGHGWPYSPADAPGLGWLFYAAGALDDRNPWWPAMPELTRYLSRLCWLLQQGEPVADVALYVPNDDLFATMGRAQGGSLDTWREAQRPDPARDPGDHPDGRAGLRPRRRRRARGHGPGTLSGWSSFRPTTSVPPATARWLERVAARRRYGADAGEPTAAEALAGAGASGPGDLARHPDIGFVHRRLRDLDVYLIVNTGPTTRTFGVVARSSRTSYEQWDALTGSALRERSRRPAGSSSPCSRTRRP